MFLCHINKSVRHRKSTRCEDVMLPSLFSSTLSLTILIKQLSNKRLMPWNMNTSCMNIINKTFHWRILGWTLHLLTPNVDITVCDEPNQAHKQNVFTSTTDVLLCFLLLIHTHNVLMLWTLKLISYFVEYLQKEYWIKFSKSEKMEGLEYYPKWLFS